MVIKPIQQHINDEYNGHKQRFADDIGVTCKQVHRYINYGAWWVNGAVVQIRHGKISLD